MLCGWWARIGNSTQICHDCMTAFYSEQQCAVRPQLRKRSHVRSNLFVHAAFSLALLSWPPLDAPWVVWYHPTENNIHVHDLLTFQQITVVPKAKGATLFSCDLQVRHPPLYSQLALILQALSSSVIFRHAPLYSLLTLILQALSSSLMVWRWLHAWLINRHVVTLTLTIMI